MLHRRYSSAATLTVALAIAAAPAAVAQDLRSPDAADGHSGLAPSSDLRSPDARDAADGRGVALAQDPRDDLRSPDARDAAAGRDVLAPEVTIVRVTRPSPAGGGVDWVDAGIGAGATLGVILVGLGGTLAVVKRRDGVPHRKQAATVA